LLGEPRVSEFFGPLGPGDNDLTITVPINGYGSTHRWIPADWSA
jgi:hypothetical protein